MNRKGSDEFADTNGVTGSSAGTKEGATCPFPCPGETEYMLLAHSLLAGTLDFALLIDEQGIILTANDNCGEFFGYSTADLYGRCILDVLPPSTGKAYHLYLQQALRTGEPLHFSDISRKGRVYSTKIHPLHNESGAIIRLAIFARDVSLEKHAERQRLLLATALENAAEAIIIMDRELRVEYVNQTFESMTGYPQSQIKGRCLDFIYANEQQREQYGIIKAWITQGEVWAGRCATTNRDGTSFECAKTVSPIRGQHGVVVGFVSVWRDLAQISELERQLREAQKMEAIGTLAGGIAHDFNNILSPIMLHAELAISQLPPNDPVLDSLKQIMEATKRAANLVDQILNISRKKSTDTPVPFSLGALVKECIKLLRPSLPASIAITYHPAVEQDVIVADPTQIHQVIMNLCTNAAHALEPQGGGELSISVSRVDNVPNPQENRKYPPYPALTPGPYLKLTVRDNGPGIPQDVIDKIFDPFFTTKKSKGTGLGLSVVRGIVSRHKGAVLVDSRPRAGARFHVLLPCPEEALSTRAELPAPSGNAPLGNGERILLVDDDEAVAGSLAATLLQLGYEVRVARSSRRALEVFTSDPEYYNVIITDLTMPGMSGDELAAHLHDIHPAIPIILGSGSLPEKDEIRAIPGVRLALGKPYDSARLAQAIRQVLDTEDELNIPVFQPR
ncbi:MAG: PAS domain S-box protein [Desulfovibrio sp.]|uniref:hybrid sensor histidine kinase/response regulator n=1 Tax=Desulfovibrio sp. 7SRBS1 TaxID=3378064 RepID=UPI003B3FB698